MADTKASALAAIAAILTGTEFYVNDAGISKKATGGQLADFVVSARAATQAEMETGTALDRIVTPGRQHFHPGHPKMWGMTTGTGTPVLSASYNVTSITDTGVGLLTVTIATDFSSANWSVQVTTQRVGTATTVANYAQPGVRNGQHAAGVTQFECWNDAATNHALIDPVSYYWAGFGDL